LPGRSSYVANPLSTRESSEEVFLSPPGQNLRFFPDSLFSVRIKKLFFSFHGRANPFGRCISCPFQGNPRKGGLFPERCPPATSRFPDFPPPSKEGCLFPHVLAFFQSRCAPPPSFFHDPTTFSPELPFFRESLSAPKTASPPSMISCARVQRPPSLDKV